MPDLPCALPSSASPLHIHFAAGMGDVPGAATTAVAAATAGWLCWWCADRGRFRYPTSKLAVRVGDEVLACWNGEGKVFYRGIAQAVTGSAVTLEYPDFPVGAGRGCWTWVLAVGARRGCWPWVLVVGAGHGTPLGACLIGRRPCGRPLSWPGAVPAPATAPPPLPRPAPPRPAPCCRPPRQGSKETLPLASSRLWHGTHDACAWDFDKTVGTGWWVGSVAFLRRLNSRALH